MKTVLMICFRVGGTFVSPIWRASQSFVRHILLLLE
jgi:hypothetical protein